MRPSPPKFLLALLAAATAVGLTGAPAAAERLGGLQVYPGASLDTASIHVRTSRGCPSTADTFYVKAAGHGFPAGGQVVTATTDAGMSHTTGFDAYLALTMKDFAVDNRTRLQGSYTFTLSCIDAFTQRSFGEFTGSISFSSPTRYEAVGAARPPASPSAAAPAATASAPAADPTAAAAPGDGVSEPSLAAAGAERPAPGGDAWWIWIVSTLAALGVTVAIQRRRAWNSAGPRRSR